MTTASTRLTRTPARHGDATRDRIVRAAGKAFSAKGFEAASTREIARAAGVKQGLLTYHFPNKDALWRAAADRIFGLLRAAVAEQAASLADLEPAERTREAIRTYVRTMAANPEFFRFIVDQGNRADARTRWMVDTHIKPGFQAMKALGLFADDPEEAPHAFFALVGAGSMLFAVPYNVRRLTGINPKSHDVIEKHADFVANLMVPPEA
jgi:TetR/AcrR family transcriptional regulator